MNIDELVQENLLLRQRINELENLLKSLTNNRNTLNSINSDTSINSNDSNDSNDINNSSNNDDICKKSTKKLVPPIYHQLKYQDDDYFYWI